MSSARPWFGDAAGASSSSAAATCMSWILLRRINYSRFGCPLFSAFFTYEDNHEGKPAA